MLIIAKASAETQTLNSVIEVNGPLVKLTSTEKVLSYTSYHEINLELDLEFVVKDFELMAAILNSAIDKLDSSLNEHHNDSVPKVEFKRNGNESTVPFIESELDDFMSTLLAKLKVQISALLIKSKNINIKFHKFLYSFVNDEEINID